MCLWCLRPRNNWRVHHNHVGGRRAWPASINVGWPRTSVPQPTSTGRLYCVDNIQHCCVCMRTSWDVVRVHKACPVAICMLLFPFQAATMSTSSTLHPDGEVLVRYTYSWPRSGSPKRPGQLQGGGGGGGRSNRPSSSACFSTAITNTHIEALNIIHTYMQLVTVASLLRKWGYWAEPT